MTDRIAEIEKRERSPLTRKFYGGARDDILYLLQALAASEARVKELERRMEIAYDEL